MPANTSAKSTPSSRKPASNADVKLSTPSAKKAVAKRAVEKQSATQPPVSTPKTKKVASGEPAKRSSVSKPVVRAQTDNQPVNAALKRGTTTKVERSSQDSYPVSDPTTISDAPIYFEEQDIVTNSTVSRRDLDLADDVDFVVSSLRDLPLSDNHIPRNAKPVKDIEDEFVDGSSFLAIIDPDFADKYDAEDYDEDEDEDNDEGDVELLEALSTPTRSAIRSTLDVPLTSNDYSERNQELFSRRNEILARISLLEGKRKLSLDGSEELRRSRFLLDEATRSIIEFNYGLVLNYVRKFTSTTSRDDSADFEAAGVVGLMRAVSSYDPTRGTKFSTWAYKPIQREILKAVRDADFKQLNPGDFEKRPDILRAVKELQNGNDEFIPTFEQVAVQAGATLDAVKRILNAPIIESLSAPMGEDGDTSLTDMIEDPSAGVEDTALARQEIKDLEQFGLACLDERELFVIGRRFGLDGEPPQRLSAIGSLLGLSREAVRQVEAKALSKLLHPVTRRKLVRHGRQ
jgi:RNA polymerase sigma factor (sigma-70 family)